MKNSLSRFFCYAGRAKGLRYDFDPKENSTVYTFVEEITSFLDNKPQHTLMHTVAILDIAHIREQMPIDEAVDQTEERQLAIINSIGSHWTEIAFLILAYPEVYWILLGAPYNNPANNNPAWCQEHFANASDMDTCLQLIAHHQNGYRPLFDPSGLRTLIKLNTLSNEKIQSQPVPGDYETLLNDRQKKGAVSIDEEMPYVFLNGYTAYRFGYRCYTVMSLKEMEAPKEIHLTMEDLDLRFEDMDTISTRSYRNPENRPSYLKIDNRFFITGVAEEDDKQRLGKSVIDKPYAGIYDLAQRLGIFTRKTEPTSLKYLSFWRQLSTRLTCLKKQNTDNDSSKKKAVDKKGSHSPANRLLSVAEILIDRAQGILKETTNCQSAVLGAILSLEAKEILHGLSMTTSLQALSLQHQFEVLAECSFYGVGAEIRTTERFNELARDTDKSVRLKEHPEEFHNRLAKTFNSQIETVNNLRLTFKEYEQFDEEDQCVIATRSLQQGLHFYSTLHKEYLPSIIPVILWRWLKKQVKLCYSFLIERYFNYLMKSGLNIFYWVAIWIGLFALLYFLCFTCMNGLTEIRDAFLQSAMTFFEMQPSGVIDGKNSWFNFLVLSELFFAYIHLGIFIAYIYQRLSRR